jgi:hypothetical protein
VLRAICRSLQSHVIWLSLHIRPSRSSLSCGVAAGDRQLRRWTTAVNVELWAAPRRSRGISYVSLGPVEGDPYEHARQRTVRTYPACTRAHIDPSSRCCGSCVEGQTTDDWVMATLPSMTRGSEATRTVYSSLVLRHLITRGRATYEPVHLGSRDFFRDRAWVAVVRWTLIPRSLLASGAEQST